MLQEMSSRKKIVSSLKELAHLCELGLNHMLLLACKYFPSKYFPPTHIKGGKFVIFFNMKKLTFFHLTVGRHWGLASKCLT